MTEKKHPIYLITGDPSLVEERVEEICHLFIGADREPQSYSRLYADSSDDPIVEANSFSMFSPLKVILYLHFETCAAAMLPELVKYASSPNPDNVLVLAGTKYPAPARGKKSPMSLLKAAVAKSGSVEELSIKKLNLRSYIQRKVNQQGGRHRRLCRLSVGAVFWPRPVDINLESKAYLSCRPQTADHKGRCECRWNLRCEEKIWHFTQAVSQKMSMMP